MDITNIHAWLERPTSIAALAVGTTRGQALASIIHGALAGHDPWRHDRLWVQQLADDLVELDPRLKNPTPESIRAAVSVVLSATLCAGLSVPTR